MMRREKKEELEEVKPLPPDIAVVRDPEQIISDAARAASALAKIVEERKLYTMIGNVKYIHVEAWLTLGRFYGLTPRIIETKKLSDDPVAYEAIAEIVHVQTDRVVSRASAECWQDEVIGGRQPRKDQTRNQIRSMAQTRAVAKAFRLVLAFVPVLAGYPSTPAEEVTQPARPQARTAEQRKMREKKARERVKELANLCERTGQNFMSAYEEIQRRIGKEIRDMTDEEWQQAISEIKEEFGE